MVTQNEHENEIHLGNFLLKNKTKSVNFGENLNENQKRISFSFSFWLLGPSTSNFLS